MKKQVLIIGAGQLGSRHLQGVLKSSMPMEVFVIDPSIDSLNIAQQRANEIKNKHDLHFNTDWINLPGSFDLVIVATNADIREKVVTQLFENYKVGSLVLEKVLFQELDSYKRVGDLLSKHEISAWVNHPRRMFKSYKLLKGLLNPYTPKVYQVVGGNWGLGCNSLHFIDLIVYLSESRVNNMDADWLSDTILESKRAGYVEFTGTIKGLLENGSIFIITSLEGEPSSTTFTIFDTDNRFVIQEGGTPQIYHYKKAHAFNLESFPFVMEFQSDLSTRLVSDLFERGTCDLPSYDEARQTHEIFIAALLNKYNKIGGLQSHILPIT